ncbi:hypothetical protein ACOM2C_18365 [Pseudarthrobacter sp. So.54]
MSADTPDGPQIPPQWSDVPGPSQQPRGGSVGLGLLLGAAALYLFYVGAFFLFGPGGPPPPGLTGAGAFIPLGVYLLVAILLAVQRRTSLFGAGLLIGFGIWTLLGGGLCMASLAQAGGLP